MIVTYVPFNNFEMELEWKLESGDDGGILHNVPRSIKIEEILSIAPWMQLIDDNSAESKNIHTHKKGSFYDLLQPEYVVTKPTNEYNISRIVVKGTNVQHWINGIKVLEYESGDDSWKEKVKASTYSDNSEYGVANEGMLADYSKKGTILFRIIRIRNL